MPMSSLGASIFRGRGYSVDAAVAHPSLWMPTLLSMSVLMLEGDPAEGYPVEGGLVDCNRIQM